MVEYGLLASKSSEIFSDLLHLRNLLYANPFPILIVFGILVIGSNFLFRK